MQDDILVSINCPTYNQEPYIADAIESFLMQQTNFKYEILIHDDASLDNTTKIVREYENKYPEIIKPIYQMQNQYSKGVKIWTIIEKRAKGKYIAVCEGDDFWTDPYKLQKQVDYMERNPECSMSVHAAKLYDFSDTQIGEVRPSHNSREYTVEEIISKGGGLFATNSMLFRTAMMKNPPKFYWISPTTDFPTYINLALQGSVYYLDECMSVYRYRANGSWTLRILQDKDYRLAYYDQRIKMLDELNKYTNYQYNNIILSTIRDGTYNTFKVLLQQGRVHELKKYKEFYEALNLRRKTSLYLKYYCPRLFNILSKCKNILIQR